MSTKKRPHDDKRVIFFWRLLCLLIVFCMLPFSIVANPIFKAFIWFLDSSLPLPSRAKLTSQLLPELKEEANNRLKGLLKGVRGVALTFDLWMSRKTEDNLSVDVHFISSDWVWHHNHIGILSCADSTSGEAIAGKMRPVLAEFDLSHRVVAIVKDGGANLATASRVLAGMIYCVALDLASPFLTSCFAHKINGACNAAVKAAAATSVSSFTLSKILNKLKSCITWTKKSSKGWHTLVLACREMRVKAVKFITSVKTRFTSTWSMLRSLITARAVVDHLYGTMPQTASTNLRQRQPTHAEWSVAAAMEDVLSHPCKLVKLAQSNGSHWLLPDALYSIAKLEAKYTEIRNQTVAISATRPDRADEDDDGDEQFNSDLKTQSDAMIDPILSEVNNMMTPFRTFDHDRRHELLATLVDPRFCLGDIFLLAARDEGERARRRSSKALMRRYKTEALLPTLLELKLHMEREKKNASTQMRAEAAPTKRRVALCDLDSDDDASGDCAPDDNGDTSEETRQLFASQIEIELTAFCEDTAAPNPDEACDVLVTQSLRNKMGVENMATQVFIHKNVDLGAQVDAALSYNFGKECYKLSVTPDIKIRSEVQEAAALLDSASAEVTADSEASSTVEARISCAEYVQSLLDDSAAIES
eukprot:jgi/Tetstr1/449458/TSEL_036553.t1